jgi:hypothetical protein
MFQSWRMEGTRGSTQIFRGKLKRRGGEKEMKSSGKLPPKSGMSEVGLLLEHVSNSPTVLLTIDRWKEEES